MGEGVVTLVHPQSSKARVERAGNIPIVMIVVVVLGMFGASVLYMSGNSARLEKKADLGELGTRLAQTAMEEVLVKVSNNCASWATPDPNAPDEPLKTYHFTPHTTRLLAGAQTSDAKIPPVRVMARVIEKPGGSPEELQKFKDLIQGNPAFGGKNHMDKWWDPNTPPPNENEVLTFQGKAGDAAYKTELDKSRSWMKPAAGDPGKEFFEATLAQSNPETKPEGKNFYDTYTRGQYKDANDPVRAAFDALPVLKPIDWYSVDNNPIVVDTSTGLPASPGANQHSVADLTLFRDKWAEAMKALGNHVQNRIDGCAGDPNYGVGAMMCGFALGAQAANNSTEEELYVESATNSGILDYTCKLVTAQAEAWLEQGVVESKKTVMAHRIVQTIQLGDAMTILKAHMIPYLMFTYNLTPRDLQVLFPGTGVEPREGPGKVSKVEAPPVTKNLTYELGERFSDNPNPKVWPYQIVNCTTKARK